ncbi:hypothetical protein V1498_02835 [Peribacillus sp. SCS-26]|uniref:hypothetical protein n=1 Tax=Paraperibacillus marinus TaxID=3115295 RepID=UPI003905914F
MGVNLIKLTGALGEDPAGVSAGFSIDLKIKRTVMISINVSFRFVKKQYLRRHAPWSRKRGRIKQKKAAMSAFSVLKGTA